jgi:hypothetical protein
MEFVNGGISLDEDFIVISAPSLEFDPKSRNTKLRNTMWTSFWMRFKKRIVLNVIYEAAYAAPCRK